MPSLSTQVMHLNACVNPDRGYAETILVDTLVSSGRPTIANNLLQQTQQATSYTSSKAHLPFACADSPDPSHQVLETITWFCFYQLYVQQHPQTHNLYKRAFLVISPLTLHKTPHRIPPVTSNLPKQSQHATNPHPGYSLPN